MAAPLFSIVVPVYNTPLDILKDTIESVQGQGWRRWELILVDDCSPLRELQPFLEAAAEADPRIKVISRTENGGISAASNDGISAATGEFLTLLDHDDMIANGALARIAQELARDAEIDFLYTDEDKLDEDGERYDTFAKPDWSPERLRNQMYIGHLSVMRMALVREVGGFDSAFDGSQDHDLTFKVTEKARRIFHLPEVLYHWRAVEGSTALASEEKTYTWDAGVNAVNAHLKRTGHDAVAVRGPIANTYSVNRPLDPSALVSIVIPTRGGSGEVWGEQRVFVLEAVRSVLTHTQHEALEIVVVYDTATPDAVLSELRAIAGDKLNLVEYTREFNYSEKCNVGFVESSGDYIVLLNDDVEVISQNFIEELVSPLADSSVGMTGAYLFYEDGIIQHGGHQYAERGYHHAMHGAKNGDPGPLRALMIDREVSGVTAACAALTREVYAEIGGFTETLPLNFNDVDFSMKVRNTGRRILWLYRVKLYHFESKTRVAVLHKWELDRVRSRWGVPMVDAYIHEEPGVQTIAERGAIRLAQAMASRDVER